VPRNLNPEQWPENDDEEIRRRTQDIDNLISQGFSVSDIKVGEDGDAAIHYHIGDWIGRYRGGHIDISHASKPDAALDMINLYDYEKGEFDRVTPADLHNHLQEWISEVGEDWMKNKDY
jgi:hypothetical protein